MSTRATIRIRDINEGDYYVYRHSDGYLNGVIPDLRRAFRLALEIVGTETWKISRPSYMSSFIIASNPSQFHQARGISGDTAYVYEVKATSSPLSWSVKAEGGGRILDLDLFDEMWKVEGFGIHPMPMLDPYRVERPVFGDKLDSTCFATEEEARGYISRFVESYPDRIPKLFVRKIVEEEL